MSRPIRPIEERFWERVEKTDTCWNWIGGKYSAGYGRLQVAGRGKSLLAHRYAYELLTGPIPEGHVIDHMCHNKGCVRPEHLRATTQKQNLEHQVSAHKNSKSGIRGVFWAPHAKMWRAAVSHHGKSVYCGYFTNIEDAEAAVVAKRLELHTHNDLDRRAA